MAVYSVPAHRRPQSFNFINVTQVSITHDYGFRPFVQVIVNDQIANATVNHISLNTVRITFQNSTTGSVILR